MAPSTVPISVSYRHVADADGPAGHRQSAACATADDIWALRDVGCEAAVTGKALYEKSLKISQVTRG